MKQRRGYVDGPRGQIHTRVFQPDGPEVKAVLVLSHQSPSSSLMFSAAYPLLTDAGVMCIGVDTPGFGGSDVPEPRPAVTDYAAVFGPVLDHYGLNDAHFLGHHTGASNICAFAARQPHRVRSLILNGPPVFTAEERAERLRKPLGPVPLRPDGSHLTQRWNGRLSATPGWTNLAAMHRNLVMTLSAGDTSWYGHKAAYEYDTIADFMLLTPRSLILTNTGDDIYFLAQRAHAMRPDMAYVALEGGTHDIVDEQPRAWCDAVMEHLTVG